MEQIVKLNGDDVITLHTGYAQIDIGTYKVAGIIEQILSDSGLGSSNWDEVGVECDVIGSNTGGWKKGKVRLCLEFIPDEPEPEQPKALESPLDYLRQQVTQIKKSRLP